MSELGIYLICSGLKAFNGKDELAQSAYANWSRAIAHQITTRAEAVSGAA